MSKTLKRNIIITLIVIIFAVMLLSLIYSKKSANAEVSTNSDVQTYSDNSDNYEDYLGFTLINNNTAYKVRAIDKKRTSISIPSIYKGLPVSEIYDNGFMSCNSLETIYVPSTVKKIGTNAFYGCKSLERVYGASGVETIGNSAFSGCTQLKYFCIYDSIVSMGSAIFRNNPNSIYVRMTEEQFSTIDGINANWTSGRTSSSQTIYGKEQICETLNGDNFSDGYKLIHAKEKEEISTFGMDDGVYLCSHYDEYGTLRPILEIAPNAFESWENENLTIEYDNRLSETDYDVFIDSEAFASMVYCKYLTINVNINLKNLKKVELSESIFINSQELITVFIKKYDKIDTIPNFTFSNCVKLTTLQFGELGKNVIPNTIIHIDNMAFGQCYSMEQIIIPNSVKTMGESVFQDWGNENFEGVAKKQLIKFEDYFPPENTAGYDTWDSGLGKEASVEYRKMEITLDPCGGIGGTTNIEAMYGQALPDIEPPQPVDGDKIKKSFGGYYTSDGKCFYDKDLNKNENWWGELHGNVVNDLYAHWDAKRYNITLILDDDDFCVFETVVEYEGKFKKIEVSTTHKKGYEFIGFFTEDGEQIYDQDLNPVEGYVYTDTSITTLKAHWLVKKIEVWLMHGNSGKKVYVEYGTKNVYEKKSDSEPKQYIEVDYDEKHYTLNGYCYDDELYFEAKVIDGKMVAECIKPLYKDESVYLDAVATAIDYNIAYVDYTKYTDGEDPSTTINIEQLLNEYNGTFSTEEIYVVKDGNKIIWKSVVITEKNLGDIFIKPQNEVASLKECYDTESKTYKIWHESQFFEMNDMVTSRSNIYGDYELMADLDLRNYPNQVIGNFTGTFSGHLHKITGFNLKIINGLRGGLFTSNSGTISNLTVSGKITVDSKGAAAYVGLLCGYNTGRIERCYTENIGGESIVSNTNYVAYIGGLVGLNEGIIYNVVNRADLYGKGNIGGIVGLNQVQKTTSYISAANNQGKIYAEISDNVSIGGIVGIMMGGRIEGCTSAGQITIYGLYNSAGGLFSPCVAKVVGTIYTNQTSYGTQFAICSIVQIGKPLDQTYIKESEEKGKIVNS